MHGRLMEPSMTKRLVIMLIVVVVVLGAVFGYRAVVNHFVQQYMASRGIPPQTVSTMTADLSAWQPDIQAVGTLRAVRGVDLSAQVSGIVSEIHFKSGDDVNAGTLLLQLRDDDDVAKLNALKATAALARITYERDQRQYKAQAISRQTVDADAQNLKNAEAQVAQQEALVSYKAVRAPFAGHLGLRQVDLGQYLSPGTPIVTLQALDPIYFDFSVPQQALGVIHTGQDIALRTDTFPGETFTGNVIAISPRVDPDTRNVQVRASFANHDHKLLPGMYANATVETGAPQQHITLPKTAVSFNPYGDIVYVVDHKGTDKSGKPQLIASQKFVTIGDTRGDQVAILSGVEKGDEVVTAGQNKLRNGIPVLIDNTVQPSDNPSPNPPNE
jgi:membrane fusion protein (multidrug efflux system)